MKLRFREEEGRGRERKRKEGRLFTFLILYVLKDNLVGLCVHNILLMRLGFYGLSGHTCILSRLYGQGKLPVCLTFYPEGKEPKY